MAKASTSTKREGSSRKPAAPARARSPRLNDNDNWDARLGFLMHDVSRLRRSAFDELMRPVGLTRSQWWILAHLSRHDGMIQSDLANMLDLGKAALGGLVDRLESSGFIERRPDDSDRRVKRVHLTAEGTRMISEMASQGHVLSERMLRGIDTEARHALADSLGRVKQNLLEMKGEKAA